MAHHYFRRYMPPRTACIPKAELIADPDNVRPTSKTTRPLKMITTGEKLLALRVNEELAPLASRSVATPQRGFVAGRHIADDIVGLGGTMASVL